jgi:hypothetical protein
MRVEISEKRWFEIAYWIWLGRYPVDDGPEVDIILFFRERPEGADILGRP